MRIICALTDITDIVAAEDFAVVYMRDTSEIGHGRKIAHWRSFSCNKEWFYSQFRLFPLTVMYELIDRIPPCSLAGKTPNRKSACKGGFFCIEDEQLNSEKVTSMEVLSLKADIRKHACICFGTREVAIIYLLSMVTLMQTTYLGRYLSTSQGICLQITSQHINEGQSNRIVVVMVHLQRLWVFLVITSIKD